MDHDPTRPVRPGDELDTGALEKLLGAPVTVEQFPRGHSNLTYLVKAGDRELVLRRPPPGAKAIKSGHDMEREYRILSRLHPVYPRVPKPVLLSGDFYLMERVRGVILRTRAPEGLDLSPEVMGRVSRAVCDNLVELHALDHEAAGLGDLGRPEGYLARQVSGWAERYRKSETETIAEMDGVARWLSEHIPASGKPSLIHNDYKYDNLVLDPLDLSRILAVLDWEMATIGDPLADLGTTLAYWFEAGDPAEVLSLGIGLTSLPGNLTRDGLIERYAEKSGRDVSGILFYYAQAVFKVAVIAQQLHYRWKQGFTKDERFAGMILATRVLARIALGSIEKGRIATR